MDIIDVENISQSRKRGWNEVFGQPIPNVNDYQQSEASRPDHFEHLPQLNAVRCFPDKSSYSNRFDDTYVTWDTRSEVYCYGTLFDVRIRFRQDHSVTIEPFTIIRQAPTGSKHYVFQLVLSDNVGEMLSTTKKRIAVLNSKAFASLKCSKGFECLQFEGLIAVDLLQSIVDHSGHIPAGKVTNINLNVYGTADNAAQIAKDLSRGGFYLQDPESIAQESTYRNPQFLELPERAYTTDIVEAHFSALFSPENNNNEFFTDPNSTETATGMSIDSDTNFNLLIDDFAQHDYLTQAFVDLRIRSTLLTHQREGLDFLLKRETLLTPESRSLWQLDEGQGEEATQQVYTHLITGSRSPDPEATRGGILADDMGLGKSLMMISVIVATKATALEYAISFTTRPTGNLEAVVAAKTTLIIVPSALLVDNWIEEINKHTVPYTLSYYKYHGQNRTIPLSDLLNHDVIFTTYGTVAAEYKGKQSVLFKVRWYRTVLDEAHMIRNPTTIQFRGVSSIASLIRWCLSGTPIQNSLDDLGSLISFLGTPILKEAAQYRRYISRQARSTSKAAQPNFKNLRLLLRSLCLRRNKSILPMSQPVETVCKVIFSAAERQSYYQLGNTMRQKIDLAVSGHNPKEAHQTVLEALLRMRIYCNNGNFFDETDDDPWTEADELASILQQHNEASCYICSCDVLSFGSVVGNGNGIITPCYHAVCSDCVNIHVTEAKTHGICPSCKAQHANTSQASHLELRPARRHGQEFPTKCKELCQNIQQNRSRSKSIVFSYWRKSLDIVGAAFEHAGIPFLRVDGTVPLGHRKRVLALFQAAEQGTVLLMTLGTGAVGLNNLTVADRVHILEPQWNPSVESQAIGRIARLGQNRVVHVIRYIVDDTVEKNVQNGQLRKLQLSKGGFGRDKASNIKHRVLTTRDIICSDVPS